MPSFLEATIDPVEQKMRMFPVHTTQSYTHATLYKSALEVVVFLEGNNGTWIIFIFFCFFLNCCFTYHTEINDYMRTEISGPIWIRYVVVCCRVITTNYFYSRPKFIANRKSRTIEHYREWRWSWCESAMGRRDPHSFTQCIRADLIVSYCVQTPPNNNT